jgi:hypothetical protein
MLFLCCITSLLPLQKEAANGGICMLLLFLIPVVLTPLLVAAIVLAGLALLDLQKRDATSFLAPALVTSGGKNQFMPAGLWHVHCLAATYHDSSSSSEG